MSGQAHNIPFALAPQAYQQMRALATQNGATVIMCLTAAFQIVLGRWAQQEDIVVGSATLGRSRPELQHLVGYFVNMLPLRGKLGQVRSLTTSPAKAAHFHGLADVNNSYPSCFNKTLADTFRSTEQLFDGNKEHTSHVYFPEGLQERTRSQQTWICSLHVVNVIFMWIQSDHS